MSDLRASLARQQAQDARMRVGVIWDQAATPTTGCGERHQLVFQPVKIRPLGPVPRDFSGELLEVAGTAFVG